MTKEQYDNTVTPLEKEQQHLKDFSKFTLDQLERDIKVMMEWQTAIELGQLTIWQIKHVSKILTRFNRQS